MKRIFNLLVIILILTVLGISYYYFNNPGPEENHGTVDTGKPSVSRVLSISFVGDILLASHVEKRMEQVSVNFPFDKVSHILSKSDFTMGNLESAIGVGGVKANKQYTFRANPKVLPAVKEAGIDILSLANNHVLDYGHYAFNETLENLKSNGLSCVGAGKDINEAFKPVIYEKKNKKVAFFGASRVIPTGSWYAGNDWPGVAGAYNPERLLQSIEDVSEYADIIVVYLHWGVERETIPKPYQRSLARLLIDNGVDVVVGTHPHVLQGFEYYKGKLIAYSLGNFVFTNIKNDSLILNVEFDEGEISSVGIIPCEIKNYRPEPLEDSLQKERFYRMIEERSFGVSINDGIISNNPENQD